MNRTALIYDSLSLDWFGVIVAAACLAGLCIACILRKLQKGSVNEILTAFCLSVPCAIIIGRIQYCISKIEIDQEGLGYVFTGMRDGGYGLYGAMLGVLIALLISAKICGVSFGEIADCVAAAGAGIITVGRFATRFTSAEIGFPMEANVFTQLNEADGLNYLSVYIFDGAVEAVIFVFCLCMFMRSYIPKTQRYSQGAVAMVFLMLHGLNQVVMDSLRTDVLALFGNEFVKSSQIIGILSWLVIISIFIFRAVKKHTFKAWHLLIIAAFIALIIIAITKEYRVGSSNYVSAHIDMGICMAIMAVLSMIIFALSEARTVEKATGSDLQTEQDASESNTVHKAAKVEVEIPKNVPATFNEAAKAEVEFHTDVPVMLNVNEFNFLSDKDEFIEGLSDTTFNDYKK